MKRKIIILYMSMAVLMMTACTKDKLITYNDDSNLYFEKVASNTSKDSTTYSFAVKDKALLQDTVYLNVRTMGKISKQSREINLAVLAGQTSAIDGQHYKLLSYVMPADSFKMRLPVLVKRSTDLLKKEVSLVLRIAASKDFQPGVANQLEYKIKINDFFSKPDNWDSRLSVFFGNFTEVKFAFIFKTLGMSTFAYPEEVPYSQMTYLKLKLKNTLAEQEKVSGPLIDEQGNRVTFPN